MEGTLIKPWAKTVGERFPCLSFGHPNHQGIQPLSGLRFLTDYQQYMDFSHYMGKGLHQQADSSTHFKDHTKGTVSTLRGLNDWAFQPIREDTQSDGVWSLEDKNWRLLQGFLKHHSMLLTSNPNPNPKCQKKQENNQCSLLISVGLSYQQRIWYDHHPESSRIS